MTADMGPSVQHQTSCSDNREMSDRKLVNTAAVGDTCVQILVWNITPKNHSMEGERRYTVLEFVYTTLIHPVSRMPKRQGVTGEMYMYIKRQN